MSEKHALKVMDLSVDYMDTDRGLIHAVTDVSFTLEPGEVLGLIGESGSGKSTAVKACMGVLSYNAVMRKGKIFLNGRSLTGEGFTDRKAHQEMLREVRGKEMAMIFQNPGSYMDPTATIASSLREAIQAHSRMNYFAANRLVYSMLEDAGFQKPKEIMRSIPGQLSGGQLQLIAYESAVIHHPSVLIADEPFSALDSENRSRMLNKLRNLNAEGTSVLLVTHDLLSAESICDRICVMYEGRIIESGTPEEILKSPREAYTQELVEAYNLMKED